MRDLYLALKTLEKYGLLPEKRGRGTFTMEGIAQELDKLPGGKKTRRNCSDEEIAQALAWRKEGYTIKEIAVDLGRAESTTRRMLGL